MMNLRIPLSVLVLASVIGLMAVTAIATMSMQKAYSQTEEKGEWCFKQNGKERCFATGTGCQTMRQLAPGREVESGCELTNTAPGGTYSK